jgi:hypothetical protein
MIAEALLGWWNLIFIVPFALALLYLALYALSGVTFGEMDADSDVDADADHDLTDADMHVNVGHHGDHDHELHAHHHPPFYVAALSWLGVGKVPLSILLMVWMLSWGPIGFVTNQLMQPHVAQEWMAALYSIPASLGGSVVITRGLVRAMAKYVPLNETYARRRHELLGMTAEAIYRVDESSGVCSLRDEHGNLHQIACRVELGQPIPKGAKVKLVGFNAEKSIYYVTDVSEPSEVAS